ncbi:creatinine amidohydrolase [Humitalea rosea]|uniref:Creatinine amidohydrolase n=1 Tax=Humitalea rosea TaxID=990373 RepID=A0A2W7J284_9PROT|nr:creatininase family protein [Humitalea rosea]PZW45699.1 creatinine amidohydrolase [Humitalea rosea]
MTERFDAYRWERQTGPQLLALAGSGALPILPVASLEQHGPHLPVWTDSAIGHETCLRAAAKLGDAIVLPPMWMGMSEHHLPFGGTISLDYAAFSAVLRCIARSVLACGFDRLMLVNSHGGNIDPLAVAARELAVELAMPIVVATPSKMAESALGAVMETQSGMMHACEAETSAWMAMDPGQVRMDNLGAAFSNAPSVGSEPPGAFRFWSFAERAPGTGVRGDPRPSTAAKGEAILDAMAEAVARLARGETVWRAPDQVWAKGRAGR